MKRLLYTLIALGLCFWSMSLFMEVILGDADARIHLYNSHESRPIFLDIYAEKAGVDNTKSHRIALRPGTGHTVPVLHSGRYIIDVLDQRKWTVSIPAENEPYDVLLDIGGRGEFYVFPIFFLPDDVVSEKAEKKLAALKRLHKEYRFHGDKKVVLPVRIDYGLDQPVPSIGPEHPGMPPLKPWEQLTPSGAAKSLLKSILGDMLSLERMAYYVLADQRRYEVRRELPGFGE